MGEQPGEKRSEGKGRAQAAGDRHNALVYARRHLKTHMEWVAFLKAGGQLPCEEVGDLAHQETAIEELNVICRVLRAAPKENHP